MIFLEWLFEAVCVFALLYTGYLLGRQSAEMQSETRKHPRGEPVPQRVVLNPAAPKAHCLECDYYGPLTEFIDEEFGGEACCPCCGAVVTEFFEKEEQAK